MGMTRRQFLGSSGAAVVAGAMARNTAFGANDRVNIALVGCGHRGRQVTGGLMQAGAQLTYLCDLRQDRMEDTWSYLSDEQDAAPALVRDMEEVFASDDVDAVVVATPEHWHALPTVLACQAGKDVYVEKPHSHNIFESQKMVEAAAKYERVVQVGTQNRSAPFAQRARELVAEGRIGKVTLVKIYGMLMSGPFHLGEAEDPPESLGADGWDTWVGRATREWPYYNNLFHHGYLHFWDFCGGDFSSDGIHQVDLALMLLGDPGLPRTVSAMGGRYLYPDSDAEQPDVQLVNWEFDDFAMTFDDLAWANYMRRPVGAPVDADEFPEWTCNATRIELYGADGMMQVGRHGSGWVIRENPEDIAESMTGDRMPGTDRDHYENFLHCVRTREQASADVSIGHAANLMTHMGNIAHRMGNVRLAFDADSEQFDASEANEYINPPGREQFSVPESI